MISPHEHRIWWFTDYTDKRVYTKDLIKMGDNSWFSVGQPVTKEKIQ
jgi:hypothetical protein